MINYRVCIVIFFLLLYNVSYAQIKQAFQFYKLWTGEAVPKSMDIPVLKNVRLKTIKKFEPEKDGYRFLHGVAIERYHKQWVVTFGHNRGGENTGSEEANSLFSKKGRKWSTLIPIGNKEMVTDTFAVSHGVLLVHEDTLWSFNASFHNIMQELHTKAYYWDRKNKNWVLKGVVAKDGFWPLQQPVQMDNGEWIMAGASVGKETVPAVAICRNNDFLQWEVNKIPLSVQIWGESSIIANGKNILLIARSGTLTPVFKGYSHPLAWVSLSNDYGHTWSELQPSNLPMADTKPYTGILSTGQRYLIATMSADAGTRRSPLTIAVSKPGQHTFSKIFAIRHAEQDKGSVESDKRASLAYPYAIEYRRHLYVVYSNSGGRHGKEREFWNNNSAELAIVPIKELAVE